MNRNLRQSVAIGLLLTAATLAVYAQVVEFDFIEFDDREYVIQNTQIHGGVTAEAVQWALTTGYAANWFPLTWISLMVDFEIWELDPAGYHATNLLLHILNTLLLFGVLESMTRRRWRSAFVAALFALHPLHVESVAWVAERKDVLSTFFGLLSMAAYVRYARRGGTAAYVGTAFFLAMGLMAKPMLVTLPFVFLLLDYWPLDRMRSVAGDRPTGEDTVATRFGSLGRSIRPLLREKLPLLALAALSSGVTWVVQVKGGTVTSTDSLPLTLRAANAVVSYVQYMRKTIWPSDLRFFYPYPVPEWGGPTLAAWQVAGALGVLLAISVWVVRSNRRYAMVGWLWYLGTLVPVIGLIQVGRQAMADRYTYVPLIGLFIIVAWGSAELAATLRHRRAEIAAGLVAALLLAALAGRSWAQARYWRAPIPLFEHALELNPRDATNHYYVGTMLGDRGQLEEAIVHYRIALGIHPRYGEAHGKLGLALHLQGRLDEAIVHYRESVELKPDWAQSHYRLGNALRLRGEVDEAIRHYRRALQIEPDYLEAQHNLRLTLQARGEPDAAP
jgi:Tfp pilus assembly protein PilF